MTKNTKRNALISAVLELQAQGYSIEEIKLSHIRKALKEQEDMFSETF